ncbi:MAG TPA: TIM barrel protein, partial [Gemmataceae bacterium]|nr:TIM barrel protein [Gemmataceae bacterium]
MKTSMNLLLWATHVTEQHFPLLGKLKQTGFDGVEIPIFDGDDNHYKRIRKELDNLGLQCTTVGLMMPDANPISPDPALRKAAVERFKRLIGWTAILGGEIFAGPFHSPLGV